MQLRSVGRTIAAIVIAAASAAACSRAASPASPSAVGGASTEATVQATNGSEQSALAAVRRATAAFHDMDAAIQAGYQSPVGGHCEASPAGTMGVHSPNLALGGDLNLNPETPEVLLYVPTGNGNYRLVAVEYFQPVLLRNTETNAVAPWFSPTHWPAQYQVVNPAPSLFGHTFQGPMAGHAPGMPWHYDLHVWAWAPNPSGTFAQWNPSISCD
jgi:hypothetical protein